MITNTNSKSTYVITDGVYAYAVGFQYNRNPDNTPQIKVYLNKLSNTPLIYGVDYTLSEDGLNVVLASITAGDRLDIIRDIPMVQLSDYVIGRIDPEQIENDFDESVMRDQQIRAEIQFLGEVPEDHEARIQECESDIDDIESYIPNQTTSVNQLADKEFVNSSIATSTATFRGTYSTLAELEAVTADDNDYGFVESVDAVGNTLYSRYKYNGTAWVFEYNLNNSSFTAAQWAAINSGITQTIVDHLDVPTGRNVGDIFLTMRTDNGLNGAVECDGSTYNTTDFSGAQSIGDLLESNKVPFVSLSVYATTIANQGWCDKFGWDGTGTTTFKVPTLNAYIWQELQVGVAGTGVLKFQQGNGGYLNSHDESLGGVAGWVRTVNSGGSFASLGNLGVSTNASQSGLAVDATNNVSDQRIMVQLVISATDAAVATCAQVLSDVADLNTHKVVAFQTPTAQNNYTWYRKYADGWTEQGGLCTDASGDGSVALPITMADTNYHISATNEATTVENAWGWVYVRKDTKTTTGFGLNSRVASGTEVYLRARWMVCGMAA